jgi:hypothetical protein
MHKSLRGFLIYFAGGFIGGLLVLFAFDAFGQSLPPNAVPSCEQNLDAVRAENIALRKQLAQTMFQSAIYEEQNTVLKKQVADVDAKGKAAEKK